MSFWTGWAGCHARARNIRPPARSNFDPQYGQNLAAYAAPCISGEIKRHFRDHRWQIRVSRHAQELLLEMRAAEEDMTQQLGHTPDDQEMARHLGILEDDLREARQANQAFTAHSLDAPTAIPGSWPTSSVTTTRR